MSLTKSFIKSRKSYKVTFELPKDAIPEGKEIRLLGQFNDWSWEKAPVLKQAKNVYKTMLELKGGSKYEYRYQVDQSYWLNDGSADYYASTPFPAIENCVVDLPLEEVATKTSPKPSNSESFNFSKVEGIGPKISELINAGGFNSYADLAKAKIKDLKAILTDAGSRYTMHDPSTWPKQAKLLDQGKMEELKKLQKQLKGGKPSKK